MRLQAASIADATLLLGSGVGALLMVGLRRVRGEQALAPVVADPAEG